jgi:putative heme-binding domain-containing protein
VQLEIVIALGRLRWADAAVWLKRFPYKLDAPLAHAAIQTLRRSGHWPAVLTLLDEPSTAPIWPVAVRAVAERFEPVVVDGLIERLATERDAVRRQTYADLLTRVYKKPGPWKYWGYRPAPRPANTEAWERTEAIAAALDRVLADPDRDVRLSVLKRMQREKVTVRVATLGRWLNEEHQGDRTAAILVSQRDQPAAEVRQYLEPMIRDAGHTPANRLAALDRYVAGLDPVAAESLPALAEALEAGPVLAELLRRTGQFAKLPVDALLLRHLTSADAEVRAAAIGSLGARGTAEARTRVGAMLHDKDTRVRRAAAAAAGKLGVKDAIDPLLKLLADAEPAVRRACMESLHLLRAEQAVPPALAALSDRALELPALELLGELGGPQHVAAVADFAQRSPSTEGVSAAVRALSRWLERPGLAAEQRQALDRAIADIHGAGGIPVRWVIRDPVLAREASRVIEQFARYGKATDAAGWHMRFAAGTEGRLQLGPADAGKDQLWFAYTDVAMAAPTPVEFLASSSGSLRVWLNGKEVYDRPQERKFQLHSDRFAGTLAKGVNRVLVQTGRAKTGAEFHLNFRRKSSSADRERLTQAALTRGGNAERGRKLFFDAEKSLCMKCHRLGEQGERIGPELTGVGSRFSRIYIVESILEPSRTIAPSFGTLVVTLTNGKVVSGVKVAETETTLTVADGQAQKYVLSKVEIEAQQPSAVSAMPEGLEKRFTEDEFVDLIAFLASQKETRPAVSAPP